MSYKDGIISAILLELKDRTGSSCIAIKKHMQANLHNNKTWMDSTFLTTLKDMVDDGDLVQNRASYKLSADFKKKVSPCKDIPVENEKSAFIKGQLRSLD